MTLRVVILGCGSSGGVPRADGNFGICDPNEVKNHRLRCSILVEKEIEYGKKTVVLIDTSPDLRQQLLKSKTKHIDAVLFTHDHADQTHGIDDLRPIVYTNQKRIDAYFDEPTKQSLIGRFGYCFSGHEAKGYPALLNPIDLPNFGDSFQISGEGGDIDFVPLLQRHGHIDSVGFRFGNFAYCNDTNFIPEQSLEKLYDLDVFIVDCLRYVPHPSHANFDTMMSWVELLKPKRTILTNLHIDMDYQSLIRQLPKEITPAFDFMEIV